MENENMLNIEKLRVSVGDKEVLKGVDIQVKKGEVHAIMGPNGSGKSTLAYSLMGHPLYEINSGSVLFDGEDIVDVEPHEKAQKGLSLAEKKREQRFYKCFYWSQQWLFLTRLIQVWILMQSKLLQRELIV